MHRSLAGALVVCTLTLGVGGCGGTKQPTLDEELLKAKQLADPETRARRLADIGERQRTGGQEFKAADTATLAADTAKLVEPPDARAQLLLLAYELHGRLGNAVGQRDLLKAAELAIDEVQDPLQQTPLLIRAAKAYSLHLDKPRIAEGLLERAEQVAATLPRPEDQVENQLRLVDAWQSLQQSEKVESLLEQSLAAARALESPRSRVEALGRAAGTAHTIGQAERSATLLDEAEQGLAAIEDGLSRGHAQVFLARQAKALGQPEKAQTLLEAAQRAALDHGDASLRQPLLDEIERASR